MGEDPWPEPNAVVQPTHMGETGQSRHTGVCVFGVGGLFLPSASSPPQVLMKVDVIYEKELLHLYVLSGIGGLVLLFLIFLALYKVGASRRLSWGQRGNIGLDQEEHRTGEEKSPNRPRFTPSFNPGPARTEGGKRAGHPYTEGLLVARTALGPVKQRRVIYTWSSLVRFTVRIWDVDRSELNEEHTRVCLLWNL